MWLLNVYFAKHLACLFVNLFFSFNFPVSHHELTVANHGVDAIGMCGLDQVCLKRGGGEEERIVCRFDNQYVGKRSGLDLAGVDFQCFGPIYR